MTQTKKARRLRATNVVRNNRVSLKSVSKIESARLVLMPSVADFFSLFTLFCLYLPQALTYHNHKGHPYGQN